MKLIQEKKPLVAVILLMVALHCAGRRSDPVRSPSCRPVNTTIAAEKDDCPVCMPITTSICGGYCITREILLNVPSPFIQRACTYKEVRYETVRLRGCPTGVDPTFTYPMALSCHCDLCKLDSSDCTVQSIRPDFCINQRVIPQ
ncbi:PREDICTED: gonadotropin subunit beta-like [Gekko japonicus]|uniref:Gonadotropin subunit beta-like n=1 Tax=Gekko japonicus TaxID=146911 RepID=A0ABM1KY19_GEKJA|nr:PREDICTED: gonadotropin subunit beta-like [Gekko japonicus]